MTKITTVGDVRDLKRRADALRELHHQRKALRAKIRRWKAKVAKHQGEVHRETLARLETQLQELS